MKIAGHPGAWIFVSHSSEDMKAVRKVRNYLEDRGASPLLFHLLAFSRPEEFWPIIEREVSVRNFFLYCESPAAEKSEWVRRERNSVENVRRYTPKRIGRIRVDRPVVDHTALDDFLAQTRVFLAFNGMRTEAHPKVEPFVSALATAGFEVTGISPSNAPEEVRRELTDALVEGWLIIFLPASPGFLRTQLQLITKQRRIDGGGRFVFVRLEADEASLQLAPLIDAVEQPETAPARLVAHLLGENG